MQRITKPRITNETAMLRTKIIRYFNFTEQHLKSGSRENHIPLCKQLISYFLSLHIVPQLSQQTLAKLTYRDSRTTVSYDIRCILERMQYDKNFKSLIERMEFNLGLSKNY